MAVLGALLAHRVSSSITSELAELGVSLPADQEGAVPKVAELPEPVRGVVEGAYAGGVADLFLASVPLAVVALVAICFLREVPLGRETGVQQRAEVEAEIEVDTTRV